MNRPPRLGRRAAATVVLLALLGVSACGGDNSSATATASSSPTAPATSASTTTATQATTTSTRACADIKTWTVDEKAAQLVVLPSLNFNVADLAPSIRAGAGGVIFLGSSSTPSDLASRMASAAGVPGPAGAPLTMADVEGGGVQRLKGAVAAFPWARDMAKTMSVSAVEQLGATVGTQMRKVGVGVDLAPVVDLDDGVGPSAENPDGDRSFSIDPGTTSAYAGAFARGLASAGVVAVVKHFPGIGGSTHNTDYGPAATRPYSQLQAADFKPFEAAIAAGVPAVMISNAYVPGLTTQPSTLSPAVVNDLLRTQLGFKGLVLTDSLSAGAISQAGYSVPQAAARSVEAGSDMILFGSTLTAADTALLSPANVEASRKAIVAAIAAAVSGGQLSASRLDDAVTHVLNAKHVAVCG